MKIVIVRHTRVGVPRGTCYGWSDVPVASTFEQEARATLERLDEEKRKCHIADFDIVLSSPLTRARKLAAFCGFPQARTDERLKEMSMGDWEMADYDALWAHDAFFRKWLDHYDTLPTPHGESFPEFYDRVARVFEELVASPAQAALVFAHGGVCACGGLFAGLFDVKHAYSPENLTPYGGIRVITV